MVLLMLLWAAGQVGSIAKATVETRRGRAGAAGEGACLGGRASVTRCFFPLRPVARRGEQGRPRIEP